MWLGESEWGESPKDRARLRKSDPPASLSESESPSLEESSPSSSSSSSSSSQGSMAWRSL